MKLTKKIIAAAAALSLTMASTATAFAEETIEGGAEYLNTTVYKLTLPTTAGMSFTLDPQGLLSATPGDKLSDIAASDKGIVTSAGVMVAYSESSVDVDCEASFYVEVSGATVAVTDSSVIGSMPATESAVAIQIENASKTTGGKISTDVSGATISTAKAATAGTALDVTATAVSPASVISQTLNKVDYVVTGSAADGTLDYVKADDDDASIFYMYIGGKVTSEADWSDLATRKATIKLKAVFTFKNADGESVGSEDAYNILYNAAFWCCSGMENTDTFPAGTTFSNVKVNGVPVESSSADAAQFGQEGVYLYITWAQCEAAGGDALGVNNADGKLSYTVTYTAGGTNYSAVYVVE